ncbi:MAG: hypothetical protein M1569_03935 [Candidatus Marsarchaeota archaeon]|nr:hypothetical protein [Candidatus Marsarchaeota archaeon]MCL5413523.1 hypothetical protein [Candidatus Marsarchaeota archaeon]
MNMGLDFDDTITVNPRFFSKFTNDLSKHGNKIYIISSCDKISEPFFEEMFENKTRRLKEWHILYEALELVKEPVPENKALLCKKLNISVMIDNDRENLTAIKGLDKAILCLQVI